MTEQRLTFIEFSHKSRHGKPYGRFKCACGNEHVTLMASVKIGRTRSCGCLKAETACGAPPRHGHSTGYKVSAEYRAWVGMRTRCRNPRQPGYRHYGGRGIEVCGRWDVFENFLADMGPKPSPKHSIDRIDNDGNYEPGNCRWATPSEQQLNKRPVVQTVGKKLDRELVRKILADTRVYRLIAADYGVNVSNVSMIKTGKIWKGAQ